MYKMKLSQKLVYTAVFSAVCVLFKFAKFPLGTFAWLTFSYIPDFLAGIFLGPVYGIAVGFVGDLLGTLLQGSPISPLVLLGNALIGGIAGVVFRFAYIKNVYMKIVGAAFCVLVIVTLGINTIAQTMPPSAVIYANYYTALIARLPQIVILAVNTVLIIALYEVFDKVIFKNLEKENKRSFL